MQIPSETQLLEFSGWTVRVRPARKQPARLLVLIHGWTGDEDSMWIFARGLPPDYWILSPRAPYPARPSGYTWRVRASGEAGPSLEDLRTSVGSLVKLVDQYSSASQLTGSTFDIAGFSQGAAMASALALLFPERIGKVAMLAGFVPKGAENLVTERPLLGKRVFMAHGSLDDMVNIEVARRSAGLLQAAGADVTFCEDSVGHKVSANCLRSLQAFLLG